MIQRHNLMNVGAYLSQSRSLTPGSPKRESVTLRYATVKLLSCTAEERMGDLTNRRLNLRRLMRDGKCTWLSSELTEVNALSKAIISALRFMGGGGLRKPYFPPLLSCMLRGEV
ncbi:MAG: hypothetical protein ACTS44_00855 [Candidatus Hodgkinia cicadicola]